MLKIQATKKRRRVLGLCNGVIRVSRSYNVILNNIFVVQKLLSYSITVEWLNCSILDLKLYKVQTNCLIKYTSENVLNKN